MTITLTPLLCAAFLGLSLLPVSHAEELPPVPNLTDEIKAFKAKHPAQDERMRDIMQNAAAELRAAMPEPGLKVGSTAPDFTLPDALGNDVRLADMLAKGPLVLTFYRGAWCPYCNLQLHALKQSLPHFAAHGAQLVAITPQTPDRSKAQIEKDPYPFPILSDLDSSVMRAYNLYFDLPPELHALYKEKFQLDITEYNGKDRLGLPVPGTFIIDQAGVVRAVFADTDYTQRMEPAEILAALDALNKTDARPAE